MAPAYPFPPVEGPPLTWPTCSAIPVRTPLLTTSSRQGLTTTRHREPSKALEPEWIAIQESERDNNVVSVDCAAKPRLCDEYGVVSYPAIRLFHADGRVDRYRGARRASA